MLARKNPPAYGGFAHKGAPSEHRRGVNFYQALFRADAAMRWLFLWDRELCAGEMLRSAGYRPARAFVRAGVWRRGVAFLLRRFMFESRLLFDAKRQTGRLAKCYIPIPRRSGSPFVRSHDFVRLLGFVGSLRDCTFLYGDPDGSTTGVSAELRIRKGTPHCVDVPFAINL